MKIFASARAWILFCCVCMFSNVVAPSPDSVAMDKRITFEVTGEGEVGAGVFEISIPAAYVDEKCVYLLNTGVPGESQHESQGRDRLVWDGTDLGVQPPGQTWAQGMPYWDFSSSTGVSEELIPLQGRLCHANPLYPEEVCQGGGGGVGLRFTGEATGSLCPDIQLHQKAMRVVYEAIERLVKEPATAEESDNGADSACPHSEVAEAVYNKWTALANNPETHWWHFLLESGYDDDLGVSSQAALGDSVQGIKRNMSLLQQGVQYLHRENAMQTNSYYENEAILRLNGEVFRGTGGDDASRSDDASRDDASQPWQPDHNRGPGKLSGALNTAVGRNRRSVILSRLREELLMLMEEYNASEQPRAEPAAPAPAEGNVANLSEQSGGASHEDRSSDSGNPSGDPSEEAPLPNIANGRPNRRAPRGGGGGSNPGGPPGPPGGDPGGGGSVALRGKPDKKPRTKNKREPVFTPQLLVAAHSPNIKDPFQTTPSRPQNPISKSKNSLTIPHAYWPSGLGVHHGRKLNMRLISVHCLYFDQAPTKSMIVNAVSSALSNQPVDASSQVSGCYSKWWTILSNFGKVTAVPHGVQVSEITIDNALKHLETLHHPADEKDSIEKYAKSFVKATSEVDLDCVHENKFVRRSWQTEKVFSHCLVSVRMFTDSDELEIGEFNFSLDIPSLRKVQHAFNIHADALATQHHSRNEFQSAFIQEQSSLVQTINTKSGFLQGEHLHGPVGSGSIQVGRGFKYDDSTNSIDPDGITYWFGFGWKSCICILPIIHLVIAVLTMVYMLYWYLASKRNKSLFQTRRREALDPCVEEEQEHGVEGEEDDESDAEGGSDKSVKEEEEQLPTVKSHGCGPDESMKILPVRRSLIGLVLQVSWVLLVLASVILLYFIGYKWIRPISDGTNIPWFDPVADDTGSRSYVNLILAVVFVEFVIFLVANHFGIATRTAFIPVQDGADASHAFVEMHVPKPGTASALRLATRAAEIADPETIEDTQYAKQQKLREDLANSAALLANPSQFVNASTATTTIRAPIPASTIDRYTNPPTQLTTRAYRPNLSPEVQSKENITTVEAIENDIKSNQTNITKTECVAVVHQDVIFRQGHRVFGKHMTKFSFNDIPYVWSEDKWCYEQHDFEWEAIRLAHMRIKSGLTSVQAANRHFYTDNTHPLKTIVRTCTAIMHFVGRPYILMTILSCLIIIPRWDVFWGVSIIMFLMVLACYIDTRNNTRDDGRDESGVQVVRDGQAVWMAHKSLVPGDIIFLSSNMVVPADALVLLNSVIVDEGSLTGDANLQEKFPIGDVKRKQREKMKLYGFNRLWAGSRIVYSHPKSIAVVTSTSGFCQKGRMLQTPNFKAIQDCLSMLLQNMYFVIFGIIAVYLSMMVIRTCYFAYLNFDGVSGISWDVQAVVVLVFLVQDLLYNELIWASFDVGLLLLPCFLCRYLVRRRLNKSDIECKSLNALPVAGNVNICAFDKTGTLTTSDMELCSIIPAGAKQFQPPIDSNINLNSLRLDIELSMACCHNLSANPDGSVGGNSLERSMFKATHWILASKEITGSGYILPPQGSRGSKNGFCRHTIGQPIEVLHTLCFDASDGTSGVVVQSGERLILFVRGSLAAILSRCSNSFDQNKAEEARQHIGNKYAVALAMRELHPDTIRKLRRIPRKELVTDLNVLTLLLFANNIKPNTSTTIQSLHQQNISSLMLTGDHIETSIQTSKEIGILANRPTIVGDVHLRPALPVRREIAIPALWTKRFIIGDEEGDFDDHEGEEVIEKSLSSIEEESDGSESVSVVLPRDDTDLVPHTVVWRNAQTQEIVTEDYILNSPPGSIDIVLTGPALCRLEQRLASNTQTDLLKKILPNLRVGARLSPNDKARIIHMLKENGNCVCYVGDGLNDVQALQTADVGIALTDDEEVSSKSSFSSNKPENINIVLDILNNGKVTLNTITTAIAFTIIQVLLKTYGRLLLEGARQVLFSYMLIRTDNMLLVCLVLLVLLISFISGFQDKRFKLVWLFLQVLIYCGALVVFNTVILKNSSINADDLTWVSQEGFTALYSMRLQTPEASIASLSFIWLLLTFITSRLVALRKLPRSTFIFVGIIMLLKLLILLLIWSGPSTITCWLGVNCDQMSYSATGSCLYGPQLVTLNRELGDEFAMPRASNESRCRFYNDVLPDEVIEPLQISTVFSGWWKSECHAPHNCFTDDVRWQSSVTLAVTTVVSVLITLVF